VHALRNIHAALAPDALLVDTQPVSAHPPVTAEGFELGTVDMRGWIETVEAVDELVDETIAAGLYELEHEQRFVVRDTFDDGPEFVATVSGWLGTQVPAALAARIQSAQPPIALAQEVRLRLLRRAGVVY
jgi:hypothetical protein